MLTPLRSVSRLTFLAVIWILSGLWMGAVQPAAFRDWPVHTSPAEVGKRLAENWLSRPFQFENTDTRQTVIYPEACTWYGALQVSRLIADRDLEERLVHKFDTFLTQEGASRIDRRPHVDHNVFGIVPFELYRLTKQAKYLDLGRGLADGQWSNPTPDGVTRQARYWIDDMYMITALQVQAFRATDDPKYLDRAAITMAKYLEKLQQPNGLFFHAPDSPYYWGRGNGWIAAGAAELLHSLPADHPQRARIVAGAQKMLAELRKDQASDGLWRQLIDKPAAWPETSGSAMFAFSMVRGVKDGWLDEETYAPAARSAWLGLVNYLDAQANVRDVCIGTNKGHSEQYYLEREKRTGDLHGQAAMIWFAMALLE